MAFTSKKVQQRKTMGFLKGATLFFLGMSAVVFMTNAFDITPVTRNAVQYIQSIFLTQNGDNLSSTGIFLDGSGGNGTFAGTMSAQQICLSGDCKTAWPVGGTSIRSTGINNIAYYSSGRVTIGSIYTTYNPLLMLYVSGSIQSTKDISASNSITAGDNVTAGGIINASCGTGSDGHGIYVADSSWIYDTSCGGGAPASTLHIQSNDDIRIYAGSNTGIFVSNAAERVGIGTNTPAYTLDVNGTGRFVKDIMANSNVLVTGKIGIGTTSPNARLDVAGDVNVSIGEENGAVIVNDGVNGTHVLEVDNDGAMKILFDSANAGYRVGIGTSSPAYTLDVNGTGRISTVKTSLIDSDTLTINSSIETIITGGNVGIGLSTPQSKLDVNGGIRSISLTEDPCANAEYPEGTIFYNSTNHYPCFCDNSHTAQRLNYNASCFY